MNNKYFLLITGLSLAACQHAGRPTFVPPALSAVPTPMVEDSGVVIAETELTGPATALGNGGERPDCFGPALGVQVETAYEDEAYLFDSNGESCAAAQVMFDGGSPAGKWAAPSHIKINFNDALGPMLTEASTDVPKIRVTAGTLAPVTAEDFMLLPEATPEDPDVMPTEVAAQAQEFMPQPRAQLDGVIHAWEQARVAEQQEQARQQLLQKSEKLLAASRDLERLSDNDLIKLHQAKIQELMSGLREAQREAELERERRSYVQAQTEQLRVEEEGQTLAKQQQMAKWRTETEVLQARLREFEQANQRLAQEKARKEAAYEQKIADLAGDLNSAERRADSTRKELVLQAAAKIAEAEKLAFAARMAEKEAITNEAARLQQEGDELMQRAMELEHGRNVVVPRLQGVADAVAKPTKPAPMPLASVPVVLHVKDQTLKDIISQVFAAAQPSAGPWMPDWQLQPEHAFILEEKWSVTVESRFAEFMDFVANKVAQTHGIDLAFRRFDQNRLFVISDE